MMQINFYTSSAGVAGDASKLLIGEYKGIEMSTLYTKYYWITPFSLWLAKKRLTKAFGFLHI